MAPHPISRPTRRRLTDYPATYWTDAATSSESLTALPALSDTQLHDPSDTDPTESQSHTEESDDDQQEQDKDEDETEATSGAGNGNAEATASIVRLAEKVEFCDPRNKDKYMVLYRAALPDETRVDSLARRGSWAIVMAGGGHFVAALWDVTGTLARHKTFHRYTSRKKQGGSQAAADEARGGGSRIRSAGSTLRRYGEQALQKEVHGLLMEWEGDFERAQCVFLRASHRDKRDLLLGWTGSPLKACADRGVVRNIPIPTRRANLKEATRVYEELCSVRISTVSLAENVKADEAQKREKQEPPPVAPKHAAVQEKKPDEKGTDHLKKREGKEKDSRARDEQSEKEVLEMDEELSQLLKACLHNDIKGLSAQLESNNELKQSVFKPHYFANEARFSKIEEPLGLVGVACVCGNTNLVSYLMDHGVSPTVGTSPYMANKSKAMRTHLRQYWGLNPSKYDYRAAGIPNALSQEEIEEMTERERARRRKDREKKKEKAKERKEAAKTPEERARELRAAAAEKRMLANRE